MKKIFIALVAIVLFTSCSSNDDSNSAETSIVGSWSLTEMNVAIPVDLNNDGSFNRNLINEIPCIEGTSNFSANNDFSQSFSVITQEEINGEIVFGCQGTERNEGTYEIVGDQIKFTIEGPEPITETFDYTLNDNTLKIIMPTDDYGTLEMVSKRD